MTDLLRRYARQQQELGYKTFFLPDSEPGKREQLIALYERFKNCSRCPLQATRTKFVFGSGNPDARLMFVGEAPGADEDLQGKPFVGKAGQLLTKMIENGMKIPRSEVFIANILKCRPPNNRDPEPVEREACTPILLEQIRIIRPQYLCCLGRVAGRFLLKLPDDASLRSMRGRFHQFMGIKVLVTYHPSALLRDETKKPDAWKDLQFLMQDMGLAIPKTH